MVLTCADWANTSRFGHVLETAWHGLTRRHSRIRELVTFVKQHPANPSKIDPHIIRNEGPIEIIAQPPRLMALTVLNPTVLGPNAWVLVIDIHSDCAGFSAAHPEHHGDQYQAQRDLTLRHVQRVADTLAVNNGHPMMVIVNYTWFDSHRTVLRAERLCTVPSRPHLFDDGWVTSAPPAMADLFRQVYADAA
ncbi:MAG TPA: hypothetical protein VMT30_05905 [Candidatus Saccharimonadia bacterium]|nr:hypothetical protein [Candidatus Saccharimonadia bacterium]